MDPQTLDPQTLDPQTLDRVITCRGYAVKKSSIDSKELEEIRKELTVAPIVNDKFSGSDLLKEVVDFDVGLKLFF